MPLQTLSQLVEEATAAQRGGVGATAQRLLLFGRVTDHLRMFVERESKRLATLQRLRLTIHEVNAVLIRLQAAAPADPTNEDLSGYYTLITQLRRDLRALEQATTPLTLFEPVLR